MALDTWAFQHRITLDGTRPGEPTDNGRIESFNAHPRDECPNVHQFHSLAHHRAIIEAWRIDYNEHRPYGPVGDLTPAQYARIPQETEPRVAA